MMVCDLTLLHCLPATSLKSLGKRPSYMNRGKRDLIFILQSWKRLRCVFVMLRCGANLRNSFDFLMLLLVILNNFSRSNSVIPVFFRLRHQFGFVAIIDG